MKSLKKFIACFVCIVMLLALGVPTFAAEPRTFVRECTKCESGTVYQHTSRVYQHDEIFPCSHGGRGNDTYAVYEVKVVESCDSCSYRYSNSYEDHILKNCPAK